MARCSLVSNLKALAFVHLEEADSPSPTQADSPYYPVLEGVIWICPAEYNVNWKDLLD